MTKTANRPSSGASGLKLVITAGSLGATLGGWALFSAAAPPPAPHQALPVVPSIPSDIVSSAVPTVAPLLSAPALANTAASDPAPLSVVPVAPAAPVLRDVSAPVAPQPVVSTRSSN